MRCLVYIFLLTSFVVNAQKNLVPNPSFEEPKPTKPSRTFTHGGYPFQKLVEPWYMPTSGTSDYYNSDRSNIYLNMPVKTARSGQGRTGLIVREYNERWKYTEYIQVKLIQPLVKDSLYCVGVHFSLDKRNRYFSTSLGICFTPQALTDTSTAPLKVKPQVLINDPVKLSAVTGWQQWQVLYKAEGGEQYLTLGCFEDQPLLPRKVTDSIPKGMQRFSRFSYYYFDDISVVPVNQAGECSAALEEKIKPAENNFLFLVDVSASMAKAGYLSQVKQALLRFVDTLAYNDQISVLGFDVRTQVWLRGARAYEKEKLLLAIEQLQAGNVTNIDKAISRTYEVMDSIYVPQAGNRVVLLSDGKFDLSSTSKKIIKNHFSQQQVSFSMVQFGQNENKGLQKTLTATQGHYLKGDEHLPENLIRLIKRPGRRLDYTPMRSGALTFEEY